DGNIVGAPLFINSTPSTNSWSTFTNDFRLQNGSAGIGTGPNGLDIGALVPPGASIAGEPASPTTNTTATLKISGPAIVGYQWRGLRSPGRPAKHKRRPAVQPVDDQCDDNVRRERQFLHESHHRRDQQPAVLYPQTMNSPANRFRTTTCNDCNPARFVRH